MNLGYVLIIIMAGAAYFVSNIPTPDLMIAEFKDAQKFYASSAYDQAIEKYAELDKIQSRFLDEDKVVVEFGEMKLRVKDAALYQIGNSYSKMASDELQKAKDAEKEEDKAKSQQLALEYVKKSTEYFTFNQEKTIDPELKILAQKRVIDAWYLVNDYEKIIEEGRELIQNYPNSVYVQDALYNIGWAYYDTKRYNESIETFNELLTRFPTGNKADRALFQMGEAYYDQGMYDKAVPYYSQLVTKMRINELTDLEIQKIQRDKLAGLTDETALDLAAKASLKIGACYANSGEFEKAAESYKRIALLFKYDKALIYEAYQRLANMYKERGDFDSCIRAYRDAIDEVADKVLKAKMQVLIAQNYFEAEQYNRAIEEYNNYINSYSDVAYRANFDLDEAFFALARSYYEYGVIMKSEQKDVGLSNLQLSINTYLRIFKDVPGTQFTERINFYLAMAYQEYGTEESLKKALETYDFVLKQFPNTGYKEYIYFKMARTYKSVKDNENAMVFYNKVINEFPQSDQLDAVWFELGLTSTEKGDRSGSVQYYLNVSRKDPKLFTTARLLAVQTLSEEHRETDVIDAITYTVEDTSVVENLYRLSQFYLLRGNAYKNSDNFDAAVEDYTRAYELNQSETRQIASVQRAGVYIEQQKYARAESDLRELMNSDDANIRRMAQIRLAIISARQGKSAQAIQTYLDLYNTTQEPDEKLGFLRNLVQLSAASEDWNNLLKFATMMINLDIAENMKPEGQPYFYKEEAYYFIANSYEKQEDYFSTVDYLLKGFDKFPNSYFSSDMLMKVGVIYLTKLTTVPDALDLAAMYLEEYINKFPDTSNTEMAHYYLGFCYYNGRRFDLSIKTFRDFARKYPNSEFTPEAIFYYSDAYYNIGNMQESISGFELMISKYPRHEKVSEALFTLAWANYEAGKEQDAITILQQVVDKHPDSEFAPTSLYSIADYYYNGQKYEEAITNYKQVLEKYPNTEVAKKVPETLEDLTETVAYIEYEKGYEIFAKAQDTKDPKLYQQALDIFKQIVEKYPDTESEVGSYSNAGICLEELNSFQEAIEMYDKVIRKYEDGFQVSEEAFKFAKMHKDYIVANRL